jgi:integrase/recombinase XerD
MSPKLDLPLPRIADWPEADRQAWQRATTQGGLLDDVGGLARYNAAKLRVLESAYGRWLGFLAVHAGLTAMTSGLDLMDSQHIKAFHDHLEARLAPWSVCSYINNLCVVARAFAPHARFSALERAARHTLKVAEPITDKRSRLVPARDLYRLGHDLMANADDESTPIRRASRYRDGLMIAMLAAKPLRRRNFTNLEIDRDLIREEHNYRIVIAGRETKNRRPIEWPLPRGLTQPIDHYLLEVRPFFLARRGYKHREPGKRMWIGENGAPLAPGQVHTHITKRTAERFGRSINPHLFRDAGSTSVAIEDPAHVGIIQPLLGHANPATAEKFYNQAGNLHAARRLQDAVEQIRKGS